MSAYTVLADQSQLGAPAFTTADAVTLDPSLDSNHVLSGDFMNFGLTAEEEPVWNMSPISPSFANWNPKSDATFVRNGQPTPPLDDPQQQQQQQQQQQLQQQQPVTLSRDMMAVFENRNAWDDTPTPPSSSRNSSADHSAIGRFPYSSVSKRRRLREHKPSIATTVSSGADSDDQDHAKREKFLERNRLAASKCRQKKKEHTMMLESRFKEQSDKRERLNSEISRLRSEILGLKNEVLRHAQCGDEPIKLHLAQMVKQIANKDRDDPAASSPQLSDTTPPMRGSVSFGFDEPLPLEDGASLEQQIRRDSEASIALSGEDDFGDFVNV
ncbi:bZIP transcription factor (Atf21), putative [Talaromyces stipitatus ATCC 10500]|uniref:BZIP transcription factor (Atf21), putative n=1 Tax=Talaromyces stipitatus (strain ATCC 10500 / CBS 375.48 / QM 6759 / NRRL 1006) TaxID=441959 RepID=B8LSR9_TALSN|nr:bZIP transcription factor (Atf21), putative [Talaromyces stipitatus ATCC 10500]EED22915.1 bZIP transcription factor (Atf21), putative [Talaromyces stipitatus ATCC 10500]